MSKNNISTDTPENHRVVFQERSIRRTWHNEEWWFALVDVVAVLTDSVQSEGCVEDLRRRDKEIENPELAGAGARARELYPAKGYPQAWVGERLPVIVVRKTASRQVCQ